MFRVLVSIASCVAVVDSEFLGKKKQISQSLFLSETFDDKHDVRILESQEELRATFVALPKNAEGLLEPSTVRYALHRYFVQKHSWYVKGLDPEGGGFNFSSIKIMGDLAPAYVLDTFAKNLKGPGFSLKDVAMLAVTLRDLIHSEGATNMLEIYEALKLDPTEDVSESDFNLALRAYIAKTAIGFDAHEDIGRVNIKLLEREAREVYSEYDDVIMWASDARLSQLFFEERNRNPFVVKRGGVPFEDADRFMYLLHAKFGNLVNNECQSTKEKLEDMSIVGTGRVPLGSFYADKTLELRENSNYLSQLGLLEEIPGHQPMLIIPNYIFSPSRCMPFSEYFSICCSNNCQGIYSKLESHIGHASATPERIEYIMSTLMGRNVSDKILSARLSDIAKRHNGEVPVHGRLFAQWLHHIYPQDCPFPHRSGSIAFMSQEEWLLANEHAESIQEVEEEQSRHMGMPLREMDPLRWDSEEELFAPTLPSANHSGMMRRVMAFVACVSFALPLARASSFLFSQKSEDKTQFV